MISDSYALILKGRGRFVRLFQLRAAVESGDEEVRTPRARRLKPDGRAQCVAGGRDDYGLQVRAEDALDRALPTRLDAQEVRERRDDVEVLRGVRLGGRGQRVH